MDVLPMCSIFQELQIVHDTGYFSALPSLEEYWQQVNMSTIRTEPASASFALTDDTAACSQPTSDLPSHSFIVGVVLKFVVKSFQAGGDQCVSVTAGGSAPHCSAQ